MMSRSRSNGMALLLVLGFLSVLMIASGAVFTYLNKTMSRATTIQNQQICLNLAEAGVEKAVAELAAGRLDYRGENHTPLGEGSFSVEVVPGERTGEFVLTAMGYRGTDTSKPQAGVVAKVLISGQGHVAIIRWQEVRKW